MRTLTVPAVSLQAIPVLISFSFYFRFLLHAPFLLLQTFMDTVIPHFIYIQIMLYSAELKRGTA